MRSIILSTLLFFFVTPIYTQEGSKIDLKNVDVSTNRLPTIILFGGEYTIRDRDKFLESLLKSQFYKSDLKILINLQEFISKREFSFKHEGAVRININSRKLQNQNRYNSQLQSSTYVSSFLRKVNSVRIDSSLERRALKNEINFIQKQIDSLDLTIGYDSINFELKDSKIFKKLYRKQNQKIRKLENTSAIGYKTGKSIAVVARLDVISVRKLTDAIKMKTNKKRDTPSNKVI